MTDLPGTNLVLGRCFSASCTLSLGSTDVCLGEATFPSPSLPDWQVGESGPIGMREDVDD